MRHRRFYERAFLVKLHMREEFIGFRHANSIKGVAISDNIVRFLADVNVDIRNVRPPCYD